MKSNGSFSVRVLTHNIRYATQFPFEGEELWSVRKTRLISELCFNTAHNLEALICLQEVLHEQLLDILSVLNEKSKEWAYIGVGRDDGAEAGEYSPILFRSSIWNVLEYKTIWLSETPHQPSKGWDAASTRILTIGRFKHCQNKKQMVAMNTHLDDQGSTSRFEAAKIIASQVASMTDTSPHGEELHCFLAGDLNSEPHMEAYQYLSTCSPLTDVQTIVPAKVQYGNSKTFTGFGHDGLPPTRIDFIFLKTESVFTESGDQESMDGLSNTRLSARGYGVLENRFDDNVYISDHRAVAVDLLVK